MSDLRINPIYEHYLTTQALANGQDINSILDYNHSYFVAHYLKLLPDNKEVKVLDVGCGYGRHLKSLHKIGYHNCYGIDISGEQINYARDILRLNNVEKADAIVWLGDKKSAFDMVLAVDILEHLDNNDLVDLCRKVLTCLKPGGKFIVQVPNGISLINPILYGDLTHFRVFTVESIKQLFLITGFIPPFEYYEIPPHNFNAISALKKILWKLFLKPIINFYIVVTYHRMSPAIYTNNFIAVAHKL